MIKKENDFNIHKFDSLREFPLSKGDRPSRSGDKKGSAGPVKRGNVGGAGAVVVRGWLQAER